MTTPSFLSAALPAASHLVASTVKQSGPIMARGMRTSGYRPQSRIDLASANAMLAKGGVSPIPQPANQRKAK